MENYQSWENEAVSQKAKFKRLRDLEKWIFFLYRKMYCKCIKLYNVKQICLKYHKLLYEFNDLSFHLGIDIFVSEMEKLGNKMTDFKEMTNSCLMCNVEDINLCQCDLCPMCWRIPDLCKCI